MRYPKFLEEKATIGITAPSAGVGSHTEDFDKSIENLKKNNWNIIESSNVRATGDVSSDAEERAKEFFELLEDDNVDAIICATGGDFLTDMLPYLEKEKIEKEKWIMGASDPTNLLYYFTTVYDIATLYGHNAGSFDSTNLHQSQKTAMEYLKGNILPQNNYDLYEKNKNDRIDGDYILTEKVEWKTLTGDIDIEGRLIGGCIDCLKYLPGTKYDHTKEFIEKYKEEGIIWYFDVFGMTTEDFYLTLFQLREAGWFEHIKGVLVGRVLFPGGYTSMTYQAAIEKILPGVPAIIEVDIGHVVPKMTMINGSVAHITYKDKKGRIEQFLK